MQSAGVTLAGFCVFLSDLEPESKICEKTEPDLECLYIFGNSKSVHGFYACSFLS